MPTTAHPVRYDANAFSQALGDLIRVVQFRDRDRACCHDLSVSQCYALEAVIQAGELSVNQLAAHLFVDKSTASRVVSGLEARGMVERVPDPSDARRVRLRATRQGLAVHERITVELTGEYRALLERFDPDVAAGMTEMLRLLAHSFSERVDTSSGRCCTISHAQERS
jgi:MarR family 2-MHQ and catechol resistance regulon transcriptional repressor